MAARSLPLSICHSCLRTLRRPRARQLEMLTSSSAPTPMDRRHLALRAAFSTASSQRAAGSGTPASSRDGGKPIVLEQPDKFRPPSHPQRLARRRSQGAYNQGATSAEREQQRTRSYPHTFPNQGTFMHWFLTNRMIHLWITMGTLTILALITLTQGFLKTSPYAHLIPPIGTLPFHPVTYVREALAVVRLHIDYTTEKANASREQKILDAQKRRLYRRAHGMEDLDAAEESGIDVRGIAPWDDGLTNKERERGGRDEVVTGRDVVAMGGKVGDDVAAFAREAKEKEREREEMQKVASGGDGGDAADGQAAAAASSSSAPPPERKRKLYFGIW